MAEAEAAEAAEVEAAVAVAADQEEEAVEAAAVEVAAVEVAGNRNQSAVLERLRTAPSALPKAELPQTRPLESDRTVALRGR